MTRFADGPEVEVSIPIDASPEVVWGFVTDINLPARFQSEFLGAEWLDEGPAPGARFLGRNAIGDRKWETTSWLVDFEPLHRFGWAVVDPEFPSATWTFILEAADNSTVLRYHRIIGPGQSGLTYLIKKYPDREEEFIATRDEEHRASMTAVLEGIKRFAEEGSTVED